MYCMAGDLPSPCLYDPDQPVDCWHKELSCRFGLRQRKLVQRTVQYVSRALLAAHPNSPQMRKPNYMIKSDETLT